MNAGAGHRELEAWQQAMLLVEQVYAMSRRFPTDEQFGLSAQLRHAAVAIPSCIAEGSAACRAGERLRFIALAAGSAAQVETQLLVAERLKLAEPAVADAVLRQCGRVGGLLNLLRASLHGPLNEETH